MKPSQSHIHTICNLRYHVRTWGDARAPMVFLLHGWMDVSASFQFLVDSFARDWYVVAPDWRGFGLTAWAPGGYWFPDYYADLDALLEIYQPGAPAFLVAHSMGGNVASMYAGMRPHRVAKLISMEGFGASRTSPTDAPKRYARWLDQLRDLPLFKTYASFEEVAARLKKNNLRLTADKAHFLAQHWAKEIAPGNVVLHSDPKHKLVNPVLNRLEEVLACWRHITRAGAVDSGRAVRRARVAHRFRRPTRRTQSRDQGLSRGHPRRLRPHDAPRSTRAPGSRHRAVSRARGVSGGATAGADWTRRGKTGLIDMDQCPPVHGV